MNYPIVIESRDDKKLNKHPYATVAQAELPKDLRRKVTNTDRESKQTSTKSKSKLTSKSGVDGKDIGTSPIPLSNVDPNSILVAEKLD